VAAPGLAPPPLLGVPIPVPDALIGRFTIPPFLLPLYQAAGARYGVEWEVLAAINEIETGYGRNLHVSSAGAVGWMQFMPSTWARWGVDANRDGVRDPYDPVDAIFSAARYLRAAGAGRDLRGAVLAYNHADWYADRVLARAAGIAATPDGVIGTLTGLGAGRLPVAGRFRYAGVGGPAVVLRTEPRAAVVAVDDGRIVARGRSAGLGRYIVLRDGFGNRFTYGNLAGLELRVRRRRTVAEGTVLGHLASANASLRFAIRVADRSAPSVPPRPILQGWRALAAMHADRVLGHGATAATDRILALGRTALARRVLSDPGIRIYPCGRADIRAGRIDRRVLATMLYLDASGLHPTISSLECGHSVLTSSGNVSEHSTGTAMDIAAVNGVTISPATQGPGSIAAVTVERLLALTGNMRPHQIISLMTFPGAGNTLALPDHANHIHVGWRPAGDTPAGARGGGLAPGQWRRLIDGLRAPATGAR
jgi:hypothetical protein